MSNAVEVRDDVRMDEREPAPNLPAQIIPAPTMPAIYEPSMARPEEQGGMGVMGIPNAYSGSRAESSLNKKPLPLIKLGHRLCGFVR